MLFIKLAGYRICRSAAPVAGAGRAANTWQISVQMCYGLRETDPYQPDRSRAVVCVLYTPTGSFGMILAPGITSFDTP